MRNEMRTPITLKIKFKSTALAQFVERYSVDISCSGIFIRTREPLKIGTHLHFEFQLQDGSSLIVGDGTVVWTREYDPARTTVAPGMGVRFDKLTEVSDRVLQHILGEKAKRDGVYAESRFDAGVRAAQGMSGGSDSATPLPPPRPGLDQVPSGFEIEESTRVMAAVQSRHLIDSTREPWFEQPTVADASTLAALASRMSTESQSGPVATGRHDHVTPPMDVMAEALAAAMNSPEMRAMGRLPPPPPQPRFRRTETSAPPPPPPPQSGVRPVVREGLALGGDDPLGPSIKVELLEAVLPADPPGSPGVPTLGWTPPEVPAVAPAAVAQVTDGLPEVTLRPAISEAPTAIGVPQASALLEVTLPVRKLDPPRIGSPPTRRRSSLVTVGLVVMLAAGAGGVYLTLTRQKPAAPDLRPPVPPPLPPPVVAKPAPPPEQSPPEQPPPVPPPPQPPAQPEDELPPVAPAAAVTPRPGIEVEVVSTPPGAAVVLEGLPVEEVTPTKVDGLDPKRTYSVEFQLKGWKPLQQKLRPTPGKPWSVTLTESDRFVEVSSLPVGADILLDGKDAGTTGRRPVRIRLPSLTTPRVLTLQRPGYLSDERSIAAGDAFETQGEREILAVMATLVKRPEAEKAAPAAKPESAPVEKLPRVEKPAAKPIVAEPTVAKPVAKPATVEKPAVAQPVAEQPAGRPAPEKPTDTPVVEKPAETPAIAKPTVEKPAAEAPREKPPEKPAGEQPAQSPGIKVPSWMKKPQGAPAPAPVPQP
ncbi:MAG: hypothetical protein EXR72_26480 [Myxococcales bacterium]|nr:hypothetical protein [Myxococcales bacterium]